MEDTPKANSVRSPRQSGLSLCLIGVLAVTASVVIWVQGRYDPALWREQSAESPQAPSSQETSVDGIEPLSPSEMYHADTLSDKINGKADLYLTAGFKSLESRRFALTDDKAQWMERYTYDMGGHPNAFSVYSVQRRGDSRKLDIAPHAYISSNGLFMVHGPYYVEMIASEASEAIQNQLTAMARAFVNNHSVTTSTISELDLFGQQHLVPGSLKLIAASAFGIQGLDWVFTADYADGAARATAFLANQDSAAQAEASAEAFIAFWNEYGGEPVATPDHLPTSRVVLILDNYEMAMVQGEYVFGVHEASGPDIGLKVMDQLRQAIGEIVQ